MSTTTQDLLRRGLEIVDSYAVWQSDVVGVGHDAEALRAVAAVVRRELEAPGAGEDVRERVAREVFTLDADWRREYWDQFRRDFPRQAQAYYDTADRILALLRTPHGEGKADEHASCTCEWMHPTLGKVDPHWPAVLDPECIVHREAALRSEAQGEEPVGAVCANCGAPNAVIAGGDLDPDEAICSVECYEQLRELGCPQAHGGDYRPKPARRGEGGGE